MAEYDAFGRKVGENEPAVTPSDGPPTPTPTPTPSAAPAPTPPPAAPPAPTGLTLSGRPSRSFGGGGGFGGMWIGAVIMVAIAVGGAIIAISATNSVDKTIRRYIPTFPAVTVTPETTPTTSTTTEPAQPPPAPPTGLGPRSMIRHAHFAPALAKLRHHLGRLTSLRLAPDGIVAQLVTRTGRLRNVQIGYKNDLREISLTGPGFTNVPTLSFASIDTRAPERLVRGAAAKAHIKATSLEYLVLTRAFTDSITWFAYFKNGHHYAGDTAGHLIRAF